MTRASRSKVSLQLLQQIVVEAASAHTVEEQVERLVAQVQGAMGVGACSLYQSFDDGVLRLVANRGFAEGSIGRISLRRGEGLVGQIAADRMPLNLPVASAHPAFQHFPESGEDAFPSFLGVPIVHLGAVNGVLVAQDAADRAFTDDEQSFLITIAAQLGPILLRLASISSGDESHLGQRSVKGGAASPGKAIGHLHLVVSDQTLQLIDEPPSSGIDQELSILEQAVERAERDIDYAKLQLGSRTSTEVLELFDFYKAMLASDQLVTLAVKRIGEGLSAFAALRASIDEHVVAFEMIEDEYLRARGEDVRHVGNKLLAAVLGQSVEVPKEAANVILLGTLVSIADIGAFRPEQLAGIICLNGSSLSHTAVLARSLGIPAVVGTGPIDHIYENMHAIVDGDSGTITFNPSPSLLRAYENLIVDEQQFQDELLEQKNLPAVTTDGFRVALLANTGLLADVRPGKARGAEGIGLYRSEIPFMTATRFPTESEQFEIYRELLEIYHPLPVTIRTLDVGSDKQLPYLPLDEENPALGWRGIRFTLDNPTIMVTQLRAMLRANQGLDNLRVLLPMVGEVKEVVEVKRLLRSLVAAFNHDGINVVEPPLGIMVEIPGVIALLPHIAEHVEFVSIGTNDLTQYLLAVDRANSRVATRYDNMHPSVLHTLADIVRINRKLGLQLSICGEMAADPAAVVLLVGLGFDSLSLNAFSLPRIKALIRCVSARDSRRLARRALKQADAAVIRQMVSDALTKNGLDYLLQRSVAAPLPLMD